MTALANVTRQSQAGAALTEYNVNGSVFRGGWFGATLQRFGVDAPGLGSLGTRLQFDWTPTGKVAQAGWLPPNLRLGVQATKYDKIDGLSGAPASDAGSVFLFAWLAF